MIASMKDIYSIVNNNIFIGNKTIKGLWYLIETEMIIIFISDSIVKKRYGNDIQLDHEGTTNRVIGILWIIILRQRKRNIPMLWMIFT